MGTFGNSCDQIIRGNEDGQGGDLHRDHADEGLHHFAQPRHLLVSGKPRSEVIYRKDAYRKGVHVILVGFGFMRVDTSEQYAYYSLTCACDGREQANLGESW